MAEKTKTIVFVAAAVVTILVAVLVQPDTGSEADAAGLGEMFFPKFTDPLASASLEILNFDEKTGDVESFHVEKKGGVWSIPSHHGYPADASDQMTRVARELVGLMRLELRSVDTADHELYGVRDPRKAKLGDTGVGKLVTVQDEKNETLMSLIIGKSASDGGGQHYVRVPDQDRVYVTEISQDKITTRFDDWIENDFLTIEPGDIKEIVFDNHTVDEELGAVVQGEKIIVRQEDSNWSAKKIPDGKRVNKKVLDGVKEAIDSLNIVDVDEKPEVLFQSLLEGNEFARIESRGQFLQMQASLVEKGFFLTPEEGSDPERPQIKVVSNRGQILVGMKDGVSYTFRFGEVAQGSEGKDGEGEKSSVNNRYMYVLANVDEDLLEKPKLKPVPKLPEGTDKGEAGEKKEKKNDDSGKDKEKKDAGRMGDEGTDGKDGAGAVKGDEATKKKDEKPTVDPAIEKLKKEIEKIKAENKTAQDAYDKKVAAAKKRVEQLRARYARWYYIISDEAYQKLRVTGATAFRDLTDDEKFLVANASKPYIKTTKSGLQYQVLKEGKGESPSDFDTVKVNYKGTLIDGTVFDQSKDEPAEFQVSGVIKGWTEALKLMKPGAKWKLFIPAELAYGEAGSGEKIGPNRALIFEVEYVGVKENAGGGGPGGRIPGLPPGIPGVR